MNMDVESGSNTMDMAGVEMKATTSVAREVGKGNQSKPLREETRKYITNREELGKKYAAVREQLGRQASNIKSTEKNIAPATVSLLNAGDLRTTTLGVGKVFLEYIDTYGASKVWAWQNGRSMLVCFTAGVNAQNDQEIVEDLQLLLVSPLLERIGNVALQMEDN